MNREKGKAEKVKKKKIPLAKQRRKALERYVTDYGNALVKETIGSLLGGKKRSKTIDDVKKAYKDAGKKLVDKIETLYKLNSFKE